MKSEVNTVEKAPDHRMLVMAYKDGLELEDLPAFVDAIEVFAAKAKQDYQNEKIKLYFLPEDLANMMIEANSGQ